MNLTIKTLLAATALGLGTFAMTPPAAALAGDNATYTGRLSNTAVGGYDPVSFFQGEGVEGSKKYTATYNGAEYRFANADNLATFEADPAAYAPQYGGYCAWAVAQGQLAPGNPDFAAVHDGKLYLNFNGDVQKTWNGDRDGFISKAEQQWPTITK